MLRPSAAGIPIPHVPSAVLPRPEYAAGTGRDLNLADGYARLRAQLGGHVPATRTRGPAAMSGDRAGEDLMTRREVAFLFRATSQAVAAWARRGRLTEVRNAEGKPRVPAR